MKKKKLSVISFILALMMCIMCIPSAMAAEGGVPTVAKMVPANGTKNVQTVGTTVQMVFTEELEQTKVEAAGSITVNNGAKILAIKLVDPKTVNIYLSELWPDTEYTLKVTQGITSKKGVAAEGGEFKFTTGSAQPYHQIPEGASDMSHPIWRLAYRAAQANAGPIEFVKDGDNDVLKFTTPWVDAPLQHWVTVEPGATYKARARVKSDKAQALRLVMIYGNDSEPGSWYRMGTKWDQQVPAGEWVDIESEFTIPPDVNNSMEVVIEITPRIQYSVVLVDDFQFYEVNTDEPAPDMDPSVAGSTKVVTTIVDSEKDITSQKLEGVGVYTKGDFAESAVVTREVFSRYMANILKSADVKSTANFENYTDVDEGYDGHIGTMVEMNILTANDKGELRPNDTITFSEVCRAFVVALGHQKALEDKTPIVAASNLGIRNATGLKASSEVTYKDLNGLLDSFLKADCLYDEFGNFKTGEVLQAKMGITKLKGIVEATVLTSLNSAQGITGGYVKIAGNTYKLIDTDVSELLGKYVTYYVKEIDGEKCVLFFDEIQKNNRILKLNAYDVVNYANNTYVYLVEDQATGKRAELESDKIVIYNGRTTSSYQATDLLPTYGWIELVDNDKNGKYDIVKITDYDTYVVESYDPTTQILRDRFSNKFIDLSKAVEVLTYKNGKSSQVGAIQTGNIVTAECSMDGKRVVLNISSNVIEGEIGEIETDDSRGVRYVTFYDVIHGDQIQTDVPCVKGYATISGATAGEGGIFYIDVFGQIAAFEKGTGSWTYGYIKKVRLWDDEFVRIEMFTENSTHETIDCVEKVKIDSYRTTGHQDTFDVLANSGSGDTNTAFVEPEVIMYKTNKDGLIKQIKTARDTTVTDDFRQLRTIQNGIYVDSMGMITLNGLGVVAVDDDTKLLRVPSDANMSDTVQFTFGKAKGALLLKQTNFTAYGLSSDKLTADLLVVKDKPVWNQDARGQGIVTDIKTKLDANDELITIITTTAATLTVDSNSPVDVNNLTGTNGATNLTLKKGDYVGWRNRDNGCVNELQIIFKGDEKTNMQGTIGTYAICAVKCHWGTATRKEKNLVEVTTANGDTAVFNTEKVSVYRVISEIGSVEKVSVNEISATAGTQIAAFTDYDHRINCMVIYQ